MFSLLLFLIALFLASLSQISEAFWRFIRPAYWFFPNAFVPHFPGLRLANHQITWVLRKNYFTGIPLKRIAVVNVNEMNFVSLHEMEVPKPDNEFRVIIIGGSQMECMHQGVYGISITTVLEKQLQEKMPKQNVRVYAACIIPGKGPITANILCNKAIHFQPDLVLYSVGMNDLIRIMNNDLACTDQYEKGNLLARLMSAFKPAVYYSFLKKSLSGLVHCELGETRYVVNCPTSTHYEKIIMKKTSYSTDIDFSSLKTYYMSVIGALNIHNIPYLIVCGPLSYSPTGRSELEGLFRTSYPAGYMHRQHTRYSEEIKEWLGTEEKYLNLMDSLPKNNQYFFDHIHLTDLGVVETCQNIVACIQKSNLLP